MAVILSKVKRDVTREDEGAWISVPELIDPATGEVPEFLVRGNNFIPFQNALSGMQMRHARRGPNAAPIAADQFHKDFGRIIAQHLLLNWRGVSEQFSRDLAEELCCRYESPIQGYVISCAREVAEVNMEFDSGSGGKLRRLLREQLEQQSGGGVSQSWLTDLVSEEPDAAALIGSALVHVEETVMPAGAEFVWTAFWVLHPDRPMSVQGFGVPMGGTVIEPIPMRIPFQAIDCYARRFGIAGEFFDVLYMLIGELDREYLDFAAERSKARWDSMRQQH